MQCTPFPTSNKTVWKAVSESNNDGKVNVSLSYKKVYFEWVSPDYPPARCMGELVLETDSSSFSSSNSGSDSDPKPGPKPDPKPVPDSGDDETSKSFATALKAFIGFVALL